MSTLAATGETPLEALTAYAEVADTVVDADAVDVVTDWASARARALTATNVTVRGPELAVLYHALSKNIVATPPSPSVVAASVSFVDSVAPALLAAIHAVQARAPTVT